jgi:hypothetical protein
MRLLVALSLVVSSLAFADVGPVQKTYCDAPDTCRACQIGPGSDGSCGDEAIDAGLEKSDCVAGRANNPFKMTYYCPPGTVVHETCGCSTVEAPIALLGLGLVSVLKRRRRALR